jgi:hypothetical protein
MTLGPGKKSLERGSTFATPRAGLRRKTPLGASTPGGRPKRRPISPASTAQRDKVRHAPCIACEHPGPCHPAHLIDRSLGGDDDPRAVVPLCPGCHRLYDDADLDLLPSLEPFHRAELAYAVELHGLVRALERITNLRWAPETSAPCG